MKNQRLTLMGFRMPSVRSVAAIMPSVAGLTVGAAVKSKNRPPSERTQESKDSEKPAEKRDEEIAFGSDHYEARGRALRASEHQRRTLGRWVIFAGVALLVAAGVAWGIFSV